MNGDFLSSGGPLRLPDWRIGKIKTSMRDAMRTPPQFHESALSFEFG
jgi:hypothetical protein